MMNLNEILAYKEIKNKNILKKKISFDSLINLSKKCNGKIYDDLKIYMIITIKWHFDYLAKTRRNPDELNTSIKFWYMNAMRVSINTPFDKISSIWFQARF